MVLKEGCSRIRVVFTWVSAVLNLCCPHAVCFLFFFELRNVFSDFVLMFPGHCVTTGYSLMPQVMAGFYQPVLQPMPMTQTPPFTDPSAHTGSSTLSGPGMQQQAHVSIYRLRWSAFTVCACACSNFTAFTVLLWKEEDSTVRKVTRTVLAVGWSPICKWNWCLKVPAGGKKETAVGFHILVRLLLFTEFALFLTVMRAGAVLSVFFLFFFYSAALAR